MKLLEGKTAIITGASRGIGRGIALVFAQHGCNVAFTYSSSVEAAQTLEAELKAFGIAAKGYQSNAASFEQAQQLVEDVLKDFDGLDILINNAGIAHVGNIESVEENDLDLLYNVNIKGIYNCIKATIPSMKKSKSGVILNLASIASSVGINDRFAYSMSKGAVLSMTYSIAKDYLTSNIRCNCISPGRVHTPFVDGFIKKNYPEKQKDMFKKLSQSQPIGRMGKPQEIADLALFLCSDEAGFITGSDYAIDGGFIKLNGK